MLSTRYPRTRNRSSRSSPFGRHEERHVGKIGAAGQPVYDDRYARHGDMDEHYNHTDRRMRVEDSTSKYGDYHGGVDGMPSRHESVYGANSGGLRKPTFPHTNGSLMEGLKGKEGDIAHLVTENKILRRLVVDQSCKIWKIMQVLQSRGLTWRGSDNNSSCSGREGRGEEEREPHSESINGLSVGKLWEEKLEISATAGGEKGDLDVEFGEQEAECSGSSPLLYGLTDMSVIKVSCSCDAQDRQFRSISDALHSLQSQGMSILVEDGIYMESLVVKMSCRIVGMGNEVIIRNDKNSAIKVTAQNVRIQNLNIKCDADPTDTTNGNTDHALSIKAADFVAECCDILTTNGHCLHADSSAASTGDSAAAGLPLSAVLRNCRIHHSSHCGVFCSGLSSEVKLENCEVEACGTAGIEVRENASVVATKCRIMSCSKSGVFSHGEGNIRLEFCDINNCGMAGVEVAKSAKAEIIGCRIYYGLKGGVFVHDSADVLIRGSQIFANSMSNIDVRFAAKARIFDNKIFDSRTSGIYVSMRGDCTARDNHIFKNGGNGIELNGGKLDCSNNLMQENTRCGLFINGECTGSVVGNDLRFNGDKSIGQHSKGRPPTDMQNNQTDGGSVKPK